MPPPNWDLPGIALVNKRRDFFGSLISAINSSMREWRGARSRVTAVAVPGFVGPVTLTRGSAAASPKGRGRCVAPGEGSAFDATFSSRAAVISQAGFLNKLKGGRTETDRVLKMSASLPRSRLMSSSPSWSERVLYVLTFIVLRLQVRRSEH